MNWLLYSSGSNLNTLGAWTPPDYQLEPIFEKSLPKYQNYMLSVTLVAYSLFCVYYNSPRYSYFDKYSSSYLFDASGSTHALQ
jgi:hypothetical protein